LDVVDREPHDVFVDGVVFASIDSGVVLHALQNASPGGFGHQSPVFPDRTVDSLDYLRFGGAQDYVTFGFTTFEQDLCVYEGDWKELKVLDRAKAAPINFYNLAKLQNAL
jgi:hypothetical protein